MIDSLILLGKVEKPHGLKGWVKARVYGNSNISDLNGLELHWVKEDIQTQLVLESSQPFKMGMLLKFEGVDSISGAEKLRGGELSIHRRYLSPPKEDEVYFQDLLGLTVVEENGKKLGRVKSFIFNKGQDILVVQDGTHEILIPAIPSLLKEVDFAAREIKVARMEGLYAITRS